MTVEAALKRVDIRFDEDIIEGTAVPVVRRRTRIRGALASPFVRARAWWRALTPNERLLWRGFLLIGIPLVWWGLPQWAVFVPGVIHIAIALGFSLSRSKRSGDDG